LKGVGGSHILNLNSKAYDKSTYSLNLGYWAISLVIDL
jgi:hypothetical protein